MMQDFGACQQQPSTVNFAVIVSFPELGLWGSTTSRAAYKSHFRFEDPKLNYGPNLNLNIWNQTAI